MTKTTTLGPIWVPLTAYRWHGGGRKAWPQWLQVYTMNGHAPMIVRAEGILELRVHNGDEFQFAAPGDWILLDQGAAQVYKDAEFRARFPHQRIMK